MPRETSQSAGSSSCSPRPSLTTSPLAAGRIRQDNSFVYVNAVEEGNPRNSFDLNFYKAGLRVGDLYPMLSVLCERYAIPRSQLDELNAEAGSRPFGHLSGGIGRDGQDFLTVYYEIEAM